MLIVSVSVFFVCESHPGNIARNVLGVFITDEQEQSFLIQSGLDEPVTVRYLYWLFGTDWKARKTIGMPLIKTKHASGYDEWWAVKKDGTPIRWKLEGEDLIALVKMPDGSIHEYPDNQRWQKENNQDDLVFWGVNQHNSAVKWVKGKTIEHIRMIGPTQWKKEKGGAVKYIPLKKGFIRGDFGSSFMTGRPVIDTLLVRFRNSMVLAGIAFAVIMPVAILIGIIAGLREGSLEDRLLSLGSIIFSTVPEFVTGILLLITLSLWLGIVPGATVIPEAAPWERPDMLVLPLLTLTLVTLGYVMRITRASIVEVMGSTYIRTAFLKGLPYRVVLFRHAIKNALIAPITVIMLHARYLIGGLVVVEVVFSYPGLGTYLLNAALLKDVNALMAGTMFMVLVCVSAQLIADIIYTFLNPRIRFS
jgi:peptide/nickel transport system permease protein